MERIPRLQDQHTGDERTSLLPLRDPDPSENSPAPRWSSFHFRFQSFFRTFLTSKYGHYFVIILVTLDVACIFAGFLVGLHICEQSLGCSRSQVGEAASGHLLSKSTAAPRCGWEDDIKRWKLVEDGLEFASLIFSCAFVAELLGGLVAFGLSYVTTSIFHAFDAVVILASLAIDIYNTATDKLEQASALIIALRLFRVFKIIEESSTVPMESMEKLENRIKVLEKENAELRNRNGGTDASNEEAYSSRGTEDH